MRFCFLPLLGEKTTKGIVGDCIDALSIACITFGVCTTLGLGCSPILTGTQRLGLGGDPSSVGDKAVVIVVITIVATLSVLFGIDTGIKYLSTFTFAIGNVFLFSLMFFDNTWYFLNVLVQTIGHYIQFLIQIGFETDAFQQLGYELDASKTNLLMGYDGDSSVLNRLAEKGVEMQNTPVTFYEESPVEFMDWWTIFYWGWWISWAPFVGLFIAKISRGRTIRNVIIGAFIVPCTFVMVFFSVLGGLGIKMQRVTELALVKDPDSFNAASPDCETMGYAGGVPVSQEAMALANAGYYPLSCRPFEGQM